MTVLALSIVVLDWIIRISTATLVSALLLLLICHRNADKSLRWFTIVVAFHLTSAFTSEVLYRNNINPNYAASVYYILVIVAYAGFFLNLAGLHRYKRMWFFLVPAHMVLSTVNLFFIQKETLNTYSAISLSFIVISMCLLFFYGQLKNLPHKTPTTTPIFLVVSAEFVVHTGQLLMKSFAHFLINIFDDNLIFLWVLHHGLGIAGYLVIVYAAFLLVRATAKAQ